MIGNCEAMIGLRSLSETPATLKVRFRVPTVPEFAPDVDWRPTNRAPIIRQSPESGDPECVVARWGLCCPALRTNNSGQSRIAAAPPLYAWRPTMESTMKRRQKK